VRARVVVSAIAVSAVAAVPLVAHATSGSSTTMQLANSVVPGLAAATDLGAVPATQKLQVVVSLAHPDAAGERATVAAVYDPKSPTYHHFLTPTQWADRFGVPATTFQHVSNWLSRDGMTVGYAPATNAIVVVDGTVAQAEHTFQVTLHNYRMNGVTFRANAEPATVPNGVVAVRGLETASAYQLPSRPTGKPAQDDCLQAACIGTVTPRTSGRSTSSPAPTAAPASKSASSVRATRPRPSRHCASSRRRTGCRPSTPVRSSLTTTAATTAARASGRSTVRPSTAWLRTSPSCRSTSRRT